MEFVSMVPAALETTSAVATTAAAALEAISHLRNKENRDAIINSAKVVYRAGTKLKEKMKKRLMKMLVKLEDLPEDIFEVNVEAVRKSMKLAKHALFAVMDMESSRETSPASSPSSSQ